jgi:hypothetical protein
MMMNRRQKDGEKAVRRIEGRRTERGLDDDEQKAERRREGCKTNRRQEDGEKVGR